MTSPLFWRTVTKAVENLLTTQTEEAIVAFLTILIAEKPSDRHRGKDSPPCRSHRRKEDYSPECHYKSHHKGHFTKKITEYPIPHVFAKLPKLETYDITTDPDEHVYHIDTISCTEAPRRTGRGDRLPEGCIKRQGAC